jgi:FAD synthase
LQEREKGIVQASTAEQARAHLMDVLHTTAVANHFDSTGASQLPEPKALGKDYGQVSVGQNFTCGIDQLVNFLSDMANEPEILATDTIIVAPVHNKNKDVTVRLMLSGVIPKSLVPAKKKGVNF